MKVDTLTPTPLMPRSSTDFESGPGFLSFALCQWLVTLPLICGTQGWYGLRKSTSIQDTTHTTNGEGAYLLVVFAAWFISDYWPQPTCSWATNFLAAIGRERQDLHTYCSLVGRRVGQCYCSTLAPRDMIYGFHLLKQFCLRVAA